MLQVDENTEKFPKVLLIFLRKQNNRIAIFSKLSFCASMLVRNQIKHALSIWATCQKSTGLIPSKGYEAKLNEVQWS